MYFRLLPLTIAAAILALGLKVAAIVHDGQAFVSESVAEEPKKKSGKEPEASEKATEEPKEAAAKEGDKAGAEPSKEGEKDAAKEGESKDAAPQQGAASVTVPGMAVGCEGKAFSQSEIDVLQSLAKRREELDVRAKDLQMREDLLKAAEMRVDGKIGELKGLKDQLEKVLNEYKQMEEAEIKSLVKIYENMKPKDAAAIFEELDMPTLLRVVERMKEAKAAPVIAAMSPEKAKNLTVRLAERGKLPEQAGAASAPDAQPAEPTQPIPLRPLPGNTTPPAKLP